MKKYLRHCSKCKKELWYYSYKQWWRANKNKCNCRSCSKKGKPSGREGKNHTKETIEKIRLSNIGKHVISDNARIKLSISRKGKVASWVTRTKMSLNSSPWNKGKCHSEETIQKIKDKRKSQVITETSKKKMRISAINRVRKYGVQARNFNPKSCCYIDRLNLMIGTNLQHALNGGEMELEGYLVDGYDENKNVVFEYDEPHHHQPKNKTKDLVKQKQIVENINPSLFLRYDERSNRLYDVETNQNLSLV